MTTEPHEPHGRNVSARVDIDALFRDVPVVTDIAELAVPDLFETDGELEEFLAWNRAERDANLA